MKDVTIQIRISKKEKNELVAAAERLDIPAAQIVRDAVRERVSDLSTVSEQTEEHEPALSE